MRPGKYLFVIYFVATVGIVHAQKDGLQTKIKQITDAVDGHVGVAVMDMSSMDTLLYNPDGIFPMQSVYKFPLALAVLKQVDDGKLSLTQKIKLTKKNLHEDTWSPLRDKYPNGGVEVTLQEILEYTVTQSDNNGCDILFNLVNGPKAVNAFIHSLGISEISIKNTEEEMHANSNLQFDNWSKARAMLKLLFLFHEKKILQPATQALLWKMMRETSVGPNRIKGLLPGETEVLHRTGTGAQLNDGRMSAVNDVGIVKLPNGKYFLIVVFISRANGRVPDLEKKIAELSLAVFQSDWLNR